MRKLIAVAAILFATKVSFSQVFMAPKGQCEISFFSPTPVEDISAVNKQEQPILNAATNAFQIRVSMIFFKFEKPLMEEHFNENYVETEKYPNATFKGKINEKIDYTKDGEYKVTVTGTLSLHGVEKERTIAGKLNIKDGKITISSVFKITFADHNITIENYYKGILPEDTEVKINAVLEPFTVKK